MTIQSGAAAPHSKTQAHMELLATAIPRLRESAAVFRRFGFMEGKPESGLKSRTPRLTV
jgi:hypothetical protein